MTLDEILDSGLFTDKEGNADYRTGKVRQQIKALMLEIVGEDIKQESGYETEKDVVHDCPACGYCFERNPA